MKRMGRSLMVFPLFFICGLLHVVLYDVPMTASIMQIIYGSYVVYWSTSVQKRIIDKRVRRILLGIAGLMLLYLVLQAMRYKLFPHSVDILRYSWYAYYVPMVITPLLMLNASLYINLQENEQPNRLFGLLWIPCVLLVLGFLTNDLHHLAFPAPDPVAPGSRGESHGIVYVFYLVWIVLMQLLALGVMLRKCALSVARRHVWIPILPYVFGALWMISSLFGLSPKMNGIALWQIGELFGFMIIGFLEGCIGIGLLPANSEYERLFSLIKIPVRIEDREGKTVFASAGAKNAISEDALIETHSAPIRGGQVVWDVDMTRLRTLNNRLTEATEQIENRNSYLRTQNREEEERTALITRSRLYDEISAIVRPQLESIHTLLGAEDVPFETRLSEINIYNVYIKRRSNMELMRSERERMTVRELYSAIMESSEYLKLHGVRTEVYCPDSREVEAERVILGYAVFQSVLEACLDSLTAMVVNVITTDDTFSMRMMLETNTFSFAPEAWTDRIMPYNGHLEITEEDGDYVVFLVLGERRSGV